MSVIPESDRILLTDSKLLLVGYGAQGRAEAQNLRRSNVQFKLGLRPNGTSWKKAVDDGFKPEALPTALDRAESIALNLPDQHQAIFYNEFLKSHPVKRLIFAHGFNIHFKLIPTNSLGPTHILVAPKGAASGLMEFYGSPNSLPAILAIEGAKSETAFAEAYARAIGCHPRGLIWASFKDETECDLFSEQVLLCGGVSSLLRRAYEVLTEAGYNPQTAYLETLFELKLIVDLLWKNGITGMRSKISPTARYGDITRGDRVIDAEVKKKMEVVLSEIQSGEFAKEFLSQIESAGFKALEKNQSEHSIEKVGEKVRTQLNTTSN